MCNSKSQAAVQVEREQAGELERSGQVQSSLAEAHSKLKAVKASLKGLEGHASAAASKLQQGDQSCLNGCLGCSGSVVPFEARVGEVAPNLP